MIYAGFGKRFLANLIDGLVFLPIIVAGIFLDRQSRTLALLFTLLLPVLSWAYIVFFHARWGQTLGKKAVNIRIVKLSGDVIGWREALLRSSVDIVLSTIHVLGMFIALSQFPESAFGSSAGTQWNKYVTEFSPGWLSWLRIVSEIWFWSELVTLLFNKKKRALHDFIAGSVVVRN